jgi:hypothetical protein
VFFDVVVKMGATEVVERRGTFREGEDSTLGVGAMVAEAVLDT